MENALIQFAYVRYAGVGSFFNGLLVMIIGHIVLHFQTERQSMYDFLIGPFFTGRSLSHPSSCILLLLPRPLQLIGFSSARTPRSNRTPSDVRWHVLCTRPPRFVAGLPRINARLTASRPTYAVWSRSLLPVPHRAVNIDIAQTLHCYISCCRLLP